MGGCPELDEETVNKYFHIIGTLWNIVGIPLVREPAFDIPIVQFLYKYVLGNLRKTFVLDSDLKGNFVFHIDM